MTKKLLLIAFIFSANFLFAGTINKPVSSQHGFIENKGQIIDQNNQLNPSVLYLYNGNGLHVQLKQAGFSYEVWKQKPLSNSPQKGENSTALGDKVGLSVGKSPLRGDLEGLDSIFIHRIDILFVHANPNAIITASEPANDYINYYTTGTSEQGVTNVHHYKKVLYQNIYANIDVEFVLNDERNCGNFKYNFIVHPNGNPNDIQLKFDGANNTSLTSDGHITIETAYGNIDESIPSTYQLDANNNQQTITASFLNSSPLGRLGGATFGIAVGKYDPTKTLIIDPFPSTYLGGTSNDGGATIATDNNHNIISCGATNSHTSIATSGAFQTSFSGLSAAFITKFNSTGSILWSTYFGGTGQTGPRGGHSVTINALNDIFIAGTTTSSTNIATSGAYQTVNGGGFDVFIAKFDSLGNRLYGTYYGGSGGDQAYGIAIDTTGQLFIGGFTTSTSSIATSGAFQTTHGGGSYDGFVAKFNSSATALLWATYYGGAGTDQGQGVATDQNNNVYLVGYTASTTGIASSGGWQTYYGGGVHDAFIVKFNSSGSRLWATYYGQDQNDNAIAIGTDVSGNVFVTGNTTSGSSFATIGPAYSGASSNSYGDAFILKFNPSGTRIWSTYYGGSGDEIGECLAIDTSGNIFLTGLTDSPDSISTAGAYQTTYGGGLYDAYVAKFNSSGIRQWGTYFGDSLTDIGYGIVVEWNGEILITGQTNSASRIANSAGYQTVFGGGPADAFIASFNIGGSLPVQLTLFDAKPIGNWQNAIGKVLCTWQTASELNNDYFEVERSVDGSKFIVIGKVKGSGTSNVVNNYQFTDEGLSAVHGLQSAVYYRLRQVDLDGKSTLSDVRVINLNQSNTNWNIYPNPATNELHIVQSAISNQQLAVSLFDVTGKQIISTILFTNTTSVNTSSLNEGMYFVRITNIDGVIVKVQKVAVLK